MKIELGGESRWITYCTNVHPAETIEGIKTALADVALSVKERICPDRPFGLGLWLPRGALDEMKGNSGLLELREWLAERDLFAFTLNAFPYSGFHQARVKEAVFLPRWDEDARRDYTFDCGEALAALLPDGVRGSISTSPLGLADPRFDRAKAIANLRWIGEKLAQLEDRTGREIVLAIEPEPCALLGTVTEAARFLDEEVFRGDTDSMRRHIGVCVDACHEAVLFQDPGAAMSALRERGVRCGKLQVTSAIRVPAPIIADTRIDRVRAFDEGRYFHQVAGRDGSGSVTVWDDLSPFLAAVRAGETGDLIEARVHFHVPVFADPEGEVGTTRSHLEGLLASVPEDDLVTHLEIETYTFDVIPEDARARLGGDDLSALLANEIGWTLETVKQGGR